MKLRNPGFGCLRIAQQISHAFGIEIDKDVVRRVLAKHYRTDNSGFNGPSWLTFIGHARDSLWSIDLFRAESIRLRSHFGDAGHGCVHPPHHRLRRRTRTYRRRIGLPNVQFCNLGPAITETP